MNTQPLAQQTFRPLDLFGFFYHLTQWASVHGLTFDDFSVSHGGSMLLMGLIDFTMEKTDDDKSWDVSREIMETGKLILNENNREEITHFQNKKIEDFTIIKLRKLKKSF